MNTLISTFFVMMARKCRIIMLSFTYQDASARSAVQMPHGRKIAMGEEASAAARKSIGGIRRTVAVVRWMLFHPGFNISFNLSGVRGSGFFFMLTAPLCEWGNTEKRVFIRISDTKDICILTSLAHSSHSRIVLSWISAFIFNWGSPIHWVSYK